MGCIWLTQFRVKITFLGIYALNTFLFWTVKYHNIHTEAYRFFSIKNYLIEAKGQDKHLVAIRNNLGNLFNFYRNKFT
jgi:hypothetical protein